MSDGSIAIVGASCRFPGAEGLEAFWRLLESGADAVSEIDPQRWSTRFYYHPDRGESGKSYTWAAGLISGIDLFEPAFFGISPREAAQMDPQQRLLLELVWHAMEDAGIRADQLAGSAAGVYIGASTTDYSDLRLGDPAGADAYFMTGNTLSIFANRISYVFDLKGPSLTVDTACSSSLVAVHHACEALRTDRIPTAIVGGVNLLLAPYPYIGFCRAAMLSRRGRCFAFDERADGYVRGEGGGVIILRRLEDALASGDAIRAVILGSGVNSDGRTIGLSLPSQAAQAALLRSVHSAAGIPPEQLVFVEMHGTGTPAGDPIEAAAVGHALGQTRSGPLPIGSVKTNIGHLEPASGMAGLLKAALALDRGILPPTLHCEQPNPKIAFDNLNLKLVHTAEPIAAAPDKRYAGVNSFGFGGTNAHVVLSAPPRREYRAAGGPMPPLVISARTEASLREMVEAWHRMLTATPPERGPVLARTAARGRDHHAHRLVALGQDAVVTAQILSDWLDGSAAPAVITGTAVSEARLAFVFSGNGAQFPAMGRLALRSNAEFRAAVEEVDHLLRPELGWSVTEFLDEGVAKPLLDRADVAQPLLFAIQVGIVRALSAIGVRASGYLGHSVGEIAAAWGAGALSLADAGRVVVARSRQQQRTQGAGRMAALALAQNATRDLLAELGSPAEIAAINAARSVTISGPGREIERLATEARTRGLGYRPLDLDFAFHSREMDPIREDLLTNLAGLVSHPPTRRLVSTVTGEVVEAAALGPDYWWRNVRHPVRFEDAAARLIGEGYRIFLEIGPRAVLKSYLTDALRSAGAEGRVLTSLSRTESDRDPFPAIAARCHAAGYDWSTAAPFDGPLDPRSIPLYRWRREPFWFDRTAEAIDLVDPTFDHPLLGFRQNGASGWVNHLDRQTLPWIADHAIEGVAVLPAAAVLEMAFAAGQWRWPAAPVLEIADLEIRHPLSFAQSGMRELRTSLVAEDWELASRLRLSNEPLTLHASGRLSSRNDKRCRLFSSTDEAPPRQQIEADKLYQFARLTGINYGPRFRTVKRIEITGSHSAVAHLDASPVSDALEGYLLHPALLDGALQALLGLLAAHSNETPEAAFLPWRFGRACLWVPFGRAPCLAKVQLTRIGVRSISANIVLTDEQENIVAELADCWFRRVELNRRGAVEDRALRVDLLPAPLSVPGSRDRMVDFNGIISRLSSLERNVQARRQEQALLLEALIGSVALASLERFIERGRSFHLSDLVESRQIAPHSVALADALLRLLERFGAAAEMDAEWRIEFSNDLPAIQEIWRLLLAEAPDLVAELALIAAAADDLPVILADGPRQSGALLSPMVEQLVHASPASASDIGLLCDVLAEIVKAWPRSQPLRVLELSPNGGGTGRILHLLRQSGVSFAYMMASADTEQATRSPPVTDSHFSVSSCQWSPRDGIEALRGEVFDIVLAVNACSRLHLDTASLVSVRDLLVPGGLFLAIEPEPNPLWDVVFGQNASWWLSGSQPLDSSPLRSAEDWRADLEAAGLSTAGTLRSGTGPWPSAFFWGIAPERSQPARSHVVEPALITVIGGDSAVATALQKSLNKAAHHAELAQFREIASLQDAEKQRIFVFLAEPSGTADLSFHISQQIIAVARLATTASERSAVLWVVTSEAHQVTLRDQPDHLVGSALWGFARTLVNEMPRLSIRLLDLPGTASPGERAKMVTAELTSGSEETEVVWTPQGRHVLRVYTGLPPRWAESSDTLSLEAIDSGGRSPSWVVKERRPVGPGEVEIEVHATGLNFRDMMWAKGLLPEEALIDGFAGSTYGLECSGIVSAVGPEVANLAVGDRVMAFAPASLSTHVVTIADAVAPIPPETSFAEAATVPVTFVTVTYALGHLAKLAPGEHVLIHAAAGGIGLAAIQYAKQRGAIVIATAGSEVKRAFLRLAGADHVLDSRDLAFGDAVREFTGGQGVDVVLNSLGGEAMERSLEVLKPFGRFLELGKVDLYLNRRIRLRPLRKNISYFAIDIDQLPVSRPDLARGLLAEVSAALFQGEIRPLAHRIFSFAELDEAFRLMQSSGHIGKLVLQPDGKRGLRLRKVPHLALRRDGTYLVTGGVDGFGYECARWLATHGAGSIALLGRRGSTTRGSEEKLAELEAEGAEVKIYQGDVSDRGSLAAVLDAIRTNQPPLRGIVHAASAINDALATEIDAGRVAAIMQPKLGGALALDALTRADPIELFLLFSSATTLVGAPGQGAYVAANMTLESLARQRQAVGRPALAIAWGPIEDAGYLAERPEMLASLARRLGARAFAAAQALAGIPTLLSSGLPAVAFAETNWAEARRFLPILATPLFADSRASGVSGSTDESLAERLSSLDAEAAAALLKMVVSEEAATILRLPAESIDPSRPLSEIGMDSLMAVELRLALENRLRVELPLVSLTEGTSVASIAIRLAQAVSITSRDDRVVALAARHEFFEEGVVDQERAAAE